MLVLSNSEKQFILYTKGFFEETEDKMEDIKVFASRNFCYPIEAATHYNTWYFIRQLFEELIKHKFIPTGGLSPASYILENIIKHNLRSDDGTLLKFILTDIRLIFVNELDIGEADESYLKLNRKKEPILSESVNIGEKIR